MEFIQLCLAPFFNQYFANRIFARYLVIQCRCNALSLSLDSCQYILLVLQCPLYSIPSVCSGTGVVGTFVCTVSPSCTLQYTICLYTKSWFLFPLPYTLTQNKLSVYIGLGWREELGDQWLSTGEFGWSRSRFIQPWGFLVYWHILLFRI